MGIPPPSDSALAKKNLSYSTLAKDFVNKSADYPTSKEEMGVLGNVTQIKIKDSNFARKHRYFFSFFKAIGSMFSRMRRIGRAKTYLSGNTISSRSNENDHDVIDRKIWKTIKSFGFSKQSVEQAASPPTKREKNKDLGGFVGVTAPSHEEVSKEAQQGVIFINTVQILNYAQNIAKEIDEVKDGEFYEMQFSTAITGVITEPHQVSFIIDKALKQFYLIDSKGTDLKKLHFYDPQNKKKQEAGVEGFIAELKSQTAFKDYSLVMTPAFQGMGDCVAVSEAVARSLAVIRQNDGGKYKQASQKYEQLPPITKEQLDQNEFIKEQMQIGESEITSAIAMVHENYEAIVTKGVRVELEGKMERDRAARKRT